MENVKELVKVGALVYTPNAKWASPIVAAPKPGSSEGFRLLCVTRTRVPYIASTTLVHRNIVNSNVLSFYHTPLSQDTAIKPALQLHPV
jgi:hypothetical protein